jgi:hypothetical protein
LILINEIFRTTKLDAKNLFKNGIGSAVLSLSEWSASEYKASEGNFDKKEELNPWCINYDKDMLQASLLFLLLFIQVNTKLVL